MMSATVAENAPSQVIQVTTEPELYPGCIPDEALAQIMAAQIAEEFREFLLVIAFRPPSLISREAVEAAIKRK